MHLSALSRSPGSQHSEVNIVYHHAFAREMNRINITTKKITCHLLSPPNLMMALVTSNSQNFGMFRPPDGQSGVPRSLVTTVALDRRVVAI